MSLLLIEPVVPVCKDGYVNMSRSREKTELVVNHQLEDEREI
jgi:hypothetical protein